MAKKEHCGSIKRFEQLVFKLVRVLLIFLSLISILCLDISEGVDFCFDGSKEGYRLSSKVIKNIDVPSGVECIFQCVLQSESCRSANFRKNSTSKNCEFLTAVASENPELLNKDEHYDHYMLLQPKREPPPTTPTQIVQSTNESSCKELLQKFPSLKNGSYYFTNASGHTYAVYCHMDEVPGCGAGGWTLVMKTDGSKSTFTYDSPYWFNKEVFSPENGLNGLTKDETKLESYWKTSFEKICLGMTVDGNTQWMALNYEANSLYSLIADGVYRNTSGGRVTWKSLIVGSSLQANCNEEGFNIVYGKVKSRIGYLANNQLDCNSADSEIGFGMSYQACSVVSNITCGNIAHCSTVDNGKKLTAAFGYILVQ